MPKGAYWVRQRGLSRDVEAFIASHVESVAQLEILLLLRNDRSRTYSPHEVGEALRIDPKWAATELKRLCDHGLFVTAGDADEAYSYAPTSDKLANDVDALAKAFSTHRVSVITAIFATPSDSVGSFADAFKLRRDKDG